MAALIRRQPAAVETISGNQPQMRAYEVHTAITLRAGQVLVENAGRADLAVAAFTADTIMGIAAHDAKQGTAWYLGADPGAQEDTGGTYGGTFMGASDLLGSIEGIGVHVHLANDDTIFEFSLDEALALADIGAIVELEVNSGIFSVSTALGAAIDFGIIVKIPNYPGQAIGDTNARVGVQVLSSASMWF